MFESISLKFNDKEIYRKDFKFEPVNYTWFEDGRKYPCSGCGKPVVHSDKTKKVITKEIVIACGDICEDIINAKFTNRKKHKNRKRNRNRRRTKRRTKRRTDREIEQLHKKHKETLTFLKSLKCSDFNPKLKHLITGKDTLTKKTKKKSILLTNGSSFKFFTERFIPICECIVSLCEILSTAEKRKIINNITDNKHNKGRFTRTICVVGESITSIYKEANDFTPQRRLVMKQSKPEEKGLWNIFGDDGNLITTKFNTETKHKIKSYIQC
jgi:hypothetical protein